jgi:hypothetical protein
MSVPFIGFFDRGGPLSTGALTPMRVFFIALLGFVGGTGGGIDLGLPELGGGGAFERGAAECGGTDAGDGACTGGGACAGVSGGGGGSAGDGAYAG